MKNKGFTLIEMLVVVVLIGIVLTIAIPSAQNLINRNSNQKIKTHMKIVDSATKLYSDKNRGVLTDNTTTCFKLNYNVLKQDLLKETDIFCSGNIIITRTGNNSGYKYDYYLNCKDSNDKQLSKSGTVPTGCKEIN